MSNEQQSTTWHVIPDGSETALCGKAMDGKPFDPKDDDKVCSPCVMAVLADHRAACDEINALYGRLDAILTIATPPNRDTAESSLPPAPTTPPTAQPGGVDVPEGETA